MVVDKGIPIRLVLYSVAILYVVVDLFVIAGPLRRAVFRQNPRGEAVVKAAKERGVVARVYFQPIMLAQVDQLVTERLWREGESLESMPPEDRLLQRRLALDELIDLHLLRLKVRYNEEKAPVSEQEIATEVAQFQKRFPHAEEFQKALKVRGWTEEELEFRIAARIQQERYLESMIEIEVSEEEVQGWFEENKESLALPDRLRARHVFRATLNRDANSERKRLEEAQEKLSRGEVSFEKLVETLSEDPRSKKRSGSLGWMQAGRLPGDFAKSVFALEPGKPSLLASKTGWHLVEVLEKRASRERTYEEAREDVRAALEAIKRREGLKTYRHTLRERDKRKIEIFEDVLSRGLDLKKESSSK